MQHQSPARVRFQRPKWGAARISPTHCCSSVGRNSSCAWVAASLHRMQEQEWSMTGWHHYFLWATDAHIWRWLDLLLKQWEQMSLLKVCTSRLHVALQLYTNIRKAQLKQKENKMFFFLCSPSTEHLCSGMKSRGQHRWKTFCFFLSHLTLVTSARTWSPNRS